jgi:DNA-binding MarR family transcriptional regulator
MGLTDEDYERLLALRTALRRFLRWSEKQARSAGLTPAQHQLLLAVRGHPDPRGPTIGEVADYLLLRHHSTVELVDRAVTARLVERERDPDDRRMVRLKLTRTSAKRLETISASNLEELERLGLKLPAASKGLAPTQPRHGLASTVKASKS